MTLTGYNIHLDTPTEILHTVLLGVVKYYWAQSIWYLKNRSKSLSLFQTCLASVHWSGLNAPNMNTEYICQYHNSLIRKHYKSLAQVMPFLVFDLVPQDILRAWNIIGTLVVLLWHTEIEDLESYLVSLSISFKWYSPKTHNRHHFRELSTIFSISWRSAHQAALSQNPNSTSLFTFQHSYVASVQQSYFQQSATSHSTTFSAYRVSSAIDMHPVATAAMCLQHRTASNTSLWAAFGSMQRLRHGRMRGR